MTTKDLRNNIDKVLGNSIRCLLPSYWWKRLFHQVADTIDEVADTIDDINDITIVDSESKLSKLDVPSGSVASVYNERKFKFSECYSITAEDSNLSDDEIFAKCTRIKAIDVNYDSLSEIDCTKLDAAFFFASYENNQLELTGALYVTGGVPLFVVITNVGTDTVFPLNSIAGQTRCNEYLSQHDIRYIGFEGSTEERLILESVFSVVEADTNVYVKGTSWEKLVKKDEDNMTVEVLDPAVIEGFALIYAFAQMGNSTDLLPVMTKFFTDGVFNLSVWNSLIQELLEFTEDGESMTDEDAEKLNKMTEAIEQMFEYNKPVYQKLKEKCEASESVVLLVDFSNTAKFGWGIEETPTLVGATHCFPAAMDSYLDINGNFSLKITSPCENATSPIELLPDGTMIFGVDGWVDKTTTVIYIPETSDDIGPRIVENNKQAVKDIYNNGEKIQNFTIKYSIGNGGTIGGEASTLLNVTSENVGFVITIRGLFYYKNQLKQLTLSDDTGIPTVVDIEGDITVDTSLSTTSTNPVQNKAVKEYVDSSIAEAITITLNTEV